MTSISTLQRVTTEVCYAEMRQECNKIWHVITHERSDRRRRWIKPSVG